MTNDIMSLEDIGAAVHAARKRLSLNQDTLAGLTNVGRRFISELEGGKKVTLEIGKVLQVLHSLGLKLTIEERNKEER